MAAADNFISPTYGSNNASNIEGKTLHSETFSLDMRAYTRLYDTSVPHDTSAPAIVFDVLDSTIQQDPKNVHKSRRLGLIATAASTVIDRELVGAWGELKRFAASYTVTKTRQDSTTLTSSSFLTVQQELREHNPANWLSDVITVSAWETRTRHEVDAELGLPVTITETVVAHGTPVPTNTTGAFYEQRQVDHERDILTAITIDGYSATKFDRETYEVVNYTFPSIFLSYVTNAGFLQSQRRSYFQFNPSIRSAFTAPVYVRVLETLVTAAEMAVLEASSPLNNGDATHKAALWVVKPQDMSYSGFLFNINVPNVLVDGQDIVATTNTDDTYYGFTTDTYTVPASSPTATAYVAAIGTEKCIEDFVKPWKYGLYWRRRVLLKLQ